MGGGRDRGRWWLWLAIGIMCILRGTHAPSVPKDDTADVINVISVENMDSLLRLRLGPELISLNGSKLEGTIANRTRRATTPLCGRPACTCAHDATKKWLNVSCVFSEQEIVELDRGSVSPNLLELRVDNMAELIIKTGTFSNTTRLNRVMLSRIGHLDIKTGAFSNISSPSFFIEIEESKAVDLDDYSFRRMGGPVSATISMSDRLSMGSNVFSWPLRISIKNVPNLVLVENTFAVESAKNSPRHGPGAKIEFQNATIDVIPNGTFPSNAQEIIFKHCHIRVISSGAFNALEISSIVFVDTDLDELKNGAISDRTLITELELNNVTLGIIEPVVLLAVNNLTVQNCRIGELREGAFKIVAARVHLMDNLFPIIRRRAFEIEDWNEVVIDGNEFDHLSPDAFSVPFKKLKGVDHYVFSFMHNKLIHAEVSALGFIPVESRVEVQVMGNFFKEPCSCNLKSWTAGLVASSDLAELLYNGSSCFVTDWLAANCFRLKFGEMPMVNYIDQICGPGTEIRCNKSSRRYPPAHQNVDFTLLLDDEKKALIYIFITVITCVTFIILIVTARWVQQRGLVGRLVSQFYHTSSLVTTASISRVNIHEYAEIQNLRNQTQLVEESDEEEMVAVDDKATQTLPEELTQDLLQSLREKLDDPENYTAAREMIEHLYDLIKVEESCNNRTSTILEDTLYAEVQPRMRPRVRNRVSNNVGTRSPSLDRLAPVHYLPRPAVVNEYAEPRDRAMSSHVYCELPGGVPDVLVSSRLLANRPLPDAPSGSHV